jgi:hypothetical protein
MTFEYKQGKLKIKNNSVLVDHTNFNKSASVDIPNVPDNSPTEQNEYNPDYMRSILTYYMTCTKNNITQNSGTCSLASVMNYLIHSQTIVSHINQVNPTTIMEYIKSQSITNLLDYYSYDENIVDFINFRKGTRTRKDQFVYDQKNGGFYPEILVLIILSKPGLFREYIHVQMLSPDLSLRADFQKNISDNITKNNTTKFAIISTFKDLNDLIKFFVSKNFILDGGVLSFKVYSNIKKEEIKEIVNKKDFDGLHALGMISCSTKNMMLSSWNLSTIHELIMENDFGYTYDETTENLFVTLDRGLNFAPEHTFFFKKVSLNEKIENEKSNLNKAWCTDRKVIGGNPLQSVAQLRKRMKKLSTRYMKT